MTRPIARSVLGTCVVGAISLAVINIAALTRTDASRTSKPSDRETVRGAFRAWADGTGSPFDLLADDAEWTIVGNSIVSKTYPSREAFMAEVIRPFNARMRGSLRPVVRGLYQDGDMIIVLFDASGIAHDGQPYHNTYSWYLQMHAGRIVKGIAFFDSIEFDNFWKRVEPATGATQ